MDYYSSKLPFLLLTSCGRETDIRFGFLPSKALAGDLREYAQYEAVIQLLLLLDKPLSLGRNHNH